MLVRASGFELSFGGEFGAAAGIQVSLSGLGIGV